MKTLSEQIEERVPHRFPYWDDRSQRRAREWGLECARLAMEALRTRHMTFTRIVVDGEVLPTQATVDAEWGRHIDALLKELNDEDAT